jgi:hypothetical protein
MRVLSYSVMMLCKYGSERVRNITTLKTCKDWVRQKSMATRLGEG